MQFRPPRMSLPESRNPLDWPWVPYPPPADARRPYHVSWSARRYASAHGGRLYVWTHARGPWRTGTVLAASVTPPSGIDFQPPVAVDGIELCFTPAANRAIKYQRIIHRTLGRFRFVARETLQTERRYLVHLTPPAGS